MSAQPQPATTASGVAAPMHSSIMRFPGEPEALLAGYDAFRAEIPDQKLIFHACLRGPDGIVIVDTCPSRQAFEEFRDADWFREALDRHGLPFPDFEDHPVHVAFASGRRVSP